MKTCFILVLLICGCQIFAADDWKENVPEPVYSVEPGYVDLYWECWEIVYRNMKTVSGMPQSPFIDEGFGADNRCNWIWDTAFMVMFCKYAPSVFPGVETLNNFYKPIHDRVKIPESVHIADNPPLFAWAEYQNALFKADTAHIRDLLLNTKYLQRHFEWLESLEKPVHDREYWGKDSVATCWKKRPLGYLWEGGRSGMDNTPRGRTGEGKAPQRPNNPEMLWVDAIAQQGLTCYYIARLAELIGETQMTAQWDAKWKTFSDTVNAYYWDSADGIYYDIHEKTLQPIKVLTPASFWPALSKMANPVQMARMVDYVKDSRYLGGFVPWVSLARNQVDFNPATGDYWRGGMWLPLAYMGIKSLEQYGYFELAKAQASQILHQQFRTYHDVTPHTIWECYAPSSNTPATEHGKICRKNFCGWSALGPISLFIENVIGIYDVNAFDRTVCWYLTRQPGSVGIKRLRFGDIVTDLICTDGVIVVSSNQAYTLIVNGKSYPVKPGKQSFKAEF